MAVGIIGSKSRKNTRPRTMRGQNTGPLAATPISVVTASFATTVWTIVFNQPVNLKGIPQYVTGAGLPTAAELSTPTTLKLTYPSGAMGDIVIPFQDLAVRNSTGGYVSPGSFDY